MTMVLLPTIDTSSLKPGAGVDAQRVAQGVPPVSCTTIDRLSPPHDSCDLSAPMTSRPSSPPPPNHPASPAPTEDCHAFRDQDTVATSSQVHTDSLPTPTTPPNVFPPAPTTGLSGAEAKACRQLLSSIQRHHAAWPFRQPVDPIAAGAPDYFDVIKNPMDLSTIEMKLTREQYETVDGFASDLHLMINNCCTYNPPHHAIHQLAKSLEGYCTQQLTKIFPTLAVATPGSCDRRSKRDVKPPRVFEPEEIPLKKSRQESKELTTRKNSKKRKSLSDDQVSHKIDDLVANLDQIQAELASLRRASTTGRSPSPTPEPEAPKKRARKSKAQGSAPSASMTSPMEIDHTAPVAVAPPPILPAVPLPPRACEYCRTTDTPMWRRGPSGKGTLCNKCGVKWRSGKVMGGDGTGPALPLFTPIRKTKKTKAGEPLPPGPLTYYQKAELTKLMEKLSGPHMERVVQIVKEGMPELAATDDLELDIEAIEQNTLSRLYDYVIKACGIGSSVLDLSTSRRNIPKDKKPRAKPGAKKAKAAATVTAAFPVAAESFTPRPAGCGLGGGFDSDME